MDLQTAQTRIREGMQYLTTSTTANNLILEALKAAQDDLEKGKSLPKFLLTEDATFTGASGVSTANLPSDFIRLYEDHVPEWTSVDGLSRRELKIGEYGYLKRRWFGSTVDTPFAMSVRKSTIKLFPTPGDAWTITYSYYAHDTELANPTDENGWLLNFPYLLIAGAGMRFAADRSDQTAVAKFMGLYKSHYTSYLAKIVDEEIMDQNVTMGGNR